MRKAQEWEQGCPNPNCTHYSLMKRGNISAFSSYLTVASDIFKCNKCEQSFSETRDTVFFDSENNRLKTLGLSISTSLIERVNLIFRHSFAPLVRESYSFCKECEQMGRCVLFANFL